MLKDIIVALDWTPNTNHAGFFVALADGLYAAKGLEVTLRSPDTISDGNTPARQVETGKATFAVAPSETAISFSTTEPEKPRLVAVAALLQGSASAIATLKSSGLDRPAKLAGKRYASYNGRFEDPIVRRMVTNDGGDGAAVECQPLAFHAYAESETTGAGSVVASHLEQGRADATWIFPSWEGVLAERAGQQLECFALEDFGIPYGYSPVLLAHPAMLWRHEDDTKAFLAATAEGYRRAAVDPAKAAAALCACRHASLADADFVHASAAHIAKSLLTAGGAWGTMEPARWSAFVDFLSASRILTGRDGKAIAREDVDEEFIFTNKFLPSDE